MRDGAMAAGTTHSGAVSDVEGMTHVVIELGETNLWVSVHSSGGRVTRPSLVAGGADGQFPAALRVTSSGRWFWGARCRHADDEILVSNILSRVEDPVAIAVGSSRVPAAYLVAQQVATVYQAVSTGPRHQLDLVHPADLSERGRATVERELRRRLPAGTPVAWVSRASAAVTAAPECGDLADGDVVGVLHVGGTTSEAVAWRQRTAGGEVGPAHVDRGNAGHALDDALVAALLPTGAGRPDNEPVDVAQLRADCAQAKVMLSSETAADIDVAGQPVRLVRGEVEELTRRLLARQLDTLSAVLALQQPSTTVRFVVLVGGGAEAPYLVEAASERFEVPVLSVPRVGDAIPAGSLPTGTLPVPVVDGAESAEDAQGDRTVESATGRRSWVTGGSLPARLRRRGGASARPRSQSKPTTPSTPSTPTKQTTSAGSATTTNLPLAGQARVLMPRPVHLGVAAAALAALWAGVQGVGLAAGSASVTASSAAANANGPLGLGVRAADQDPAQAPGGLAFTPGGATYTVPPWLAGGDPTGSTRGAGGHALPMITAGGSPSAVPSKSPTTSPSTTSAPAATTAAGAPSSAPAATTPAVKASPSTGTKAPATGSGSTGSTPATPQTPPAPPSQTVTTPPVVETPPPAPVDSPSAKVDTVNPGGVSGDGAGDPGNGGSGDGASGGSQGGANTAEQQVAAPITTP